MNIEIEHLKEKIEQFKNNIKDYKSKLYDEYNTRADFIDVLFSALGWDMYNKQGVIEQFRGVVREDKVIIQGKKKAPDYAFKIGPQVVFYVEAKKPSVDIKNDLEPAYQLRRYAHTQGLSLSILTDFEEIAVYDTRIKPDPKDKTAVARVFYCTYDKLFEKYINDDHESNFDFLLNTFGKQAILNGSFNRYAEENKNKKGTGSVDKGFLELLNKWRENLAVNIALKNEDIDEYNLNIAVQKIIDRLVFLRIAEDRLIEETNYLLNITKTEKLYKSLLQIFEKADDKYNSGLFTSEDWLINLDIENNPLSEIINEMYYPKCPYEFSVLPIEILGNAYEQFLGKTIRFIRKTKYGHKVEIEEKPEVRKAGGVYYTPDYIVDYIVENTVGEKIKKLKPEEILEIKILDSACGSGSFLIGAYDFLLRFHLEYYLRNETQKKKALKEGTVYQISEEKYKLSTSKKAEILVNNIFGVDIDPQAVEVTKLSLLLKVLEDENLEYKEELFKAQHHHLLPDLSENIKCGNSLIGSDFYSDKDLSLFGMEELRKFNTFNWEDEFKKIFLKGGFNCVIGNPPYVRVDSLEKEGKKYIKDKFSSAIGKYDLYYLFVENTLNLLNSDGYLGYIIPNRFTTSNSGEALRKKIIDNVPNVFINSVSKIRVFEDASTYPNIIFFYGNKAKNEKLIIKESESVNELKKMDNLLELTSMDFKVIPYTIFPLNSNRSIIDLYHKALNNSILLEESLTIQEGMRIPREIEQESGDYHILKQFQFHRYSGIKEGSFVESVVLEKYISPTSNRFINCMKDKLVIAEDALRIEGIIDNSKSICQGGVYFATLKDGIALNLKYILGVLNSKFLTKIYEGLFAGMHMGGGYLRFRTSFLNKLPIKILTSNNTEIINEIILKVDQIIDTNNRYLDAKSDNDKKVLKTKVDLIDDQIDELIYKLFDLTSKEINFLLASK